MNPGEHVHMLRAAELQFRLASAVKLATGGGTQPLDLPAVWVHGQHQVTHEEVELTDEGADLAAMLLQRAATFLMAIQIQEALTDFANNDARNHPDPNVRAAFEIARLIRNGFTHQPLHPMWSIDPPCRNKVYSVAKAIGFGSTKSVKVIELDTSSLDGKDFDWRHYGGPLAILHLCEFVRVEILGDSGSFGAARDKKSVPTPKVRYFQQGNLILKALDEPERNK